MVGSPNGSSSYTFGYMAAKRGPKQMSADHLAKLEHGRAEGRAVRVYLEALRESKPKRGRKRTQESITKQLADIESRLPEASAIEELKLVQDRRDLQAELASMGESIDVSALEADFVKVAKAYGDRKGISYASWREVGVPAAVLARADIPRGNS
ncbi:MAG TPA: hypothetical protein VMM60_11310 [Ilumatobacter sp.]|nr:hypothetical protein [Ilumatobacter sp.]